MREAAFVKQNKEKWIAFEKAITLNSKIAPDALADHYIHLTNDLAYAQTYFPESKTLQYLNSLASQAHQKIYRNKKETKNRIVSFWKYEFPLFFVQYHKTLFYTFLIFVLATFIGAISTYYDDSFVRLILGDGYVNETLSNIEKGDPMAIYKSGGEIGTFLGITINNIRVAMLAYAFGVMISIGTGWVLFSNGIMLGSFMTFFYNRGLLFEASKSVWLHGTIEISVIVIAGCAGIVMGNSILFPKTYSRMVSFVKGAKDGLKIVLSTIPFFIIAGFIEGFITRYSSMPVPLALTIIFASLALIVYYYVIYPIQLNRKHAADPH
ncbi:MAG TPA: stage II sporulation protein M [Flavobacteriaceae bacterium]|nr:stage II sporulation protein M [Flavobacteriaceae bacterium]MCB9213830.1 stage II sporulation protein M [Alteromonas sp.]HPF11226.1 stage II sporulation protein M [Flavobacteriaceae bacterium]HQU21705.1 stage II sporulation protein M [Flavobacteriaceae bacterium]HQU64555.1 stage II sporulation protein M [Flavobacteriaceae bacterium]